MNEPFLSSRQSPSWRHYAFQTVLKVLYGSSSLCLLHPFHLHIAITHHSCYATWGTPSPCAKLFSKISAGRSWFLHAATWVDQFSFLIFQFVLRKLQRPYHVGGMSCNSAGYHFRLNLQELNQWHLIPLATDRVNLVQYGQTQIMRVWVDGTYSGRIELWKDTSICQLWPILSELYAKTH